MNYVPSRSSLAIRFHIAGQRVYGKRWDHWRQSLCAIVTDYRTYSSKEITADEMMHLIGSLEAQTPTPETLADHWHRERMRAEAISES